MLKKKKGEATEHTSKNTLVKEDLNCGSEERALGSVRENEGRSKVRSGGGRKRRNGNMERSSKRSRFGLHVLYSGCRL